MGSPDFFESVMSFLDGSAPGIEAGWDSPGVRERFSRSLEVYRERALEWVGRRDGSCLGKGQGVADFDTFWNWIMAQMDAQVLTWRPSPGRR